MPQSRQDLLDFLEGWAAKVDWSAVEVGARGEQRPMVVVGAAPESEAKQPTKPQEATGRFAPRKKYARPSAGEALFDQKLVEARGYVGKIEGILQSLAARFDSARLRQAVPAEADVERIEALFGQYHHALSRAGDAWLRNDLGAAAYARLAAVATPADLGLPLHVDIRQSRAAQAQEEQIGRRLGGRTAALERIEAAIRLLEGPPPGVELPIGGGVVVTLVQTDGPWSIVKYVPSEKGFPYAKPVRSGTAGTLGGVTLAATIVRWWLLLGAERPPAAPPAPPSADNNVAGPAGAFDGENEVQYNETREQTPARKAGSSKDRGNVVTEDVPPDRPAENRPSSATDSHGLKSRGTFKVKVDSDPDQKGWFNTTITTLWRPPAPTDPRFQCNRVTLRGIVRTKWRRIGFDWGNYEWHKDRTLDKGINWDWVRHVPLQWVPPRPGVAGQQVEYAKIVDAAGLDSEPWYLFQEWEIAAYCVDSKKILGSVKILVHTYPLNKAIRVNDGPRHEIKRDAAPANSVKNFAPLVPQRPSGHWMREWNDGTLRW
jgi:hypothetical protein